jgi:hypothetical protein
MILFHAAITSADSVLNASTLVGPKSAQRAKTPCLSQLKFYPELTHTGIQPLLGSRAHETKSARES